MTVALYARVSSQRQTNTQTIEQQLDRLRARAEESGAGPSAECLVFRDDGYSGTTLRRPGLDALRDAVASAAVERVLITAPDRLARKYVHHVLLLEELERFGCVVEFLDRPMSADPHDQLLLQIRGAVAEYERTLIAERMRQMAARTAGQAAHGHAVALDPSALSYGYRVDPNRPRDPSGVQVDPAEGAVIQEIFARYLADGATLGDAGHRGRSAEAARDPHAPWATAVESVEPAVDAAQSSLSGAGLRLPNVLPPGTPAPFAAAAYRAPGNDLRAGRP